MECSNLIKALNVIENYSFKNCHYSKTEVQSLVNILAEVIQELEHFLDKKSDKCLQARLKLCLLQMRCTVKQIMDLLNDSTYLKKTDILKLITKKIHLCLKEILNIDNNKTLSTSDKNYHTLMSEVMSLLKCSHRPSDISCLIDDLLCTSLTIAKISISGDFNEISSSCKNVLTALSSLKEESCENTTDLNYSYLLYHVRILERKVNSAVLRLFLYIMSYPQETLKKLVKASGRTSKSERFSEDLDEEISAFDLTCDRIGLMGNFAIMSCEQENFKLKVKNSLANLEFCEERLVPACIDFYLDPSNDKRGFLKYLSSEWTSEVHLINSLLNSIIDPATFSLVVFDDLSELLQTIRSNDKTSDHLIQVFYLRCQKMIQFMDKSPDCITDKFVIGLKNSLESELKNLEAYATGCSSLNDGVHNLEVTLSLVDQISEYLNKILNNGTALSEDITYSTIKDMTVNTCSTSATQSVLQNSSSGFVSKEWNISYKENVYEEKNKLLFDCYLETAHKNSPFVFTLYQKTPVKKKIRDHVALSLDVSRCLGESFEA